jgi:hypothetical protein
MQNNPYDYRRILNNSRIDKINTYKYVLVGFEVFTAVF